MLEPCVRLLSVHKCTLYVHTYVSSKHPADVISASTRDKESRFTVAEGNGLNT